MPKFDDTLVASLICPTGRKDALFFDGTLKGFGVRVTAKGRRTFLFQYRAATGVRRLPIGEFGVEVTTAKARAKAEQYRGQVRGGGDPVGDLAARRAAAVEKAAAVRAAANEVAFTVRALLHVWDEIHLAKKRGSYQRDAVARLNLHLADMLDRPAASLKRTEIVRELDRIQAEAGETTARRVHSYARAAWNWTRKRGAIEGNPFEGLPKMGQEVQRDRVLEAAEVGAIWRAAEKIGPVHGGFARFLLLTLCRREEAARMTWNEVSADRSKWTIPAGRSKNRKAHIVHLVPEAKAILDIVPRIKGNALVFAVTSEKGLSSFSFIARELGQSAEADRWRLHDFRRTGVTVLASMGFPPHVCDRLLNHVQGTIRGVAAIYQRHEFEKERQAALKAWARYVVACAEDKALAVNVLNFKSNAI